MKRLLLFILALIQLVGCTDKPQRKSVSSTSRVDTNNSDTGNIIYSDKPQTSFQVFKDGNEWKYRSTEVNYKVLPFFSNPFGRPFSDVAFEKDLEYFIVKFTTVTYAAQGSEEEDKAVTVDIRPLKAPNHEPLVIKQKCDKIDLDDDYYQTTKHSCCGGEDEFEVFDFQCNPLAKGNVQILKATVPNSGIAFFVGYKPNFQDSAYIGTLFLGYKGTDNYQIRIMPCKSLPNKCDYMTPGIIIWTPNKKDNFIKENNEYDLWSLEKITDKSQINKVTLKLVFECTTDLKIDTVEIPIINGKPFGKDEKKPGVYLCR